MRFEIEIKDNKTEKTLKIKGDDFLEISLKRDQPATVITVVPKEGVQLWTHES